MSFAGSGRATFPRSEREFRAVQAAKERALEEDPMAIDPARYPAVRPEVVMSWKRSLLAGVDPSATEFPHDPGFSSSSRLSQVAQPIMERLADEISDLSSWGFLVDRGCRLLTAGVGDAMQAHVTSKFDAVPGRCFSEDLIGTNGIGCAHELQQPFVIAGPEHFRESDEVLTTVGVVIRDPFTKRQVGTLGIACRHQYASAATVPLAVEFGRSIEVQLGTTRSDVERAIFEAFLQLCSRSRAAVVAVGTDLFIANDKGRELVGGADQEMLRRLAEESLGARGGTRIRRQLSSGRQVFVEITPIGNRRSGHGAVLSLQEAAPVAVCTATKPPVSVPEDHGALLQRALDRGDGVLLVGERGVGKRHAARAALADDGLAEFDGVLATDDGWLSGLAAAVSRPESSVLLTHADQIPPSVLPAVAGYVRAARCTLVATAGDDSVAETPSDEVRDEFAVVITVPPLRDRMHELKDISRAILVELQRNNGREIRLSARALAALHAVDWHGNIRQLYQVLATSRVRAAGGEIKVHDLPPRYSRYEQARSLTHLERLERRALATALSEVDGNRALAAERLGISRATVYRKVKAYGLH